MTIGRDITATLVKRAGTSPYQEVYPGGLRGLQAPRGRGAQAWRPTTTQCLPASRACTHARCRAALTVLEMARLLRRPPLPHLWSPVCTLLSIPWGASCCLEWEPWDGAPRTPPCLHGGRGPSLSAGACKQRSSRPASDSPGSPALPSLPLDAQPVREEARPADLHALPDPRAREGVSLQSVSHSQEENRDSARTLFDRETDQSVVPEPADEVEEGEQDEAGRAGHGRVPGVELREKQLVIQRCAAL